MTSSAIATRFAPSPTGHLHLGNARTALLSYLAARKGAGRFILRVEDTDETRSTDEFMSALYEDLQWLGMAWDEGPDVGGPHAPYRQQQRKEVYAGYLEQLDAAGLTYPCYCTPAELSIGRKRMLAAGKPPRYPGTCRDLTLEQRAEREARGLPAALRYRVTPGETVEFVDVVHGQQRFLSDDIGDFIIRRADGSFAFFFSNAIDDAMMQVTLVLRGDDHLTNTPRQLMILKSLQLTAPEYGHVALLLGMDGAPLSKRNGALSLRELRERGYLPGALRNHLVRLGHTVATPGWLDEQTMIAEFDRTKLGRAAAKFDDAQLLHWQKEAVAQLSVEAFQEWIADQLPPGIDAAALATFVAAVRHNIVFPTDARRWVDVVFGTLGDHAPEAVVAIREAGNEFFSTAGEVFAHTRDFKAGVREIGQQTGRKGPALYMPLRAALTGETHGPELAPLLPLIPPAEVASRLTKALDLARS